MGGKSNKGLTREGLISRTVAQLRARDPLVILSHGMGVETAAIWARWFRDPASRPFKSWDRLVVVTSQVGHEHVDTVGLMERHQLPEIREAGVRFVELARRGHLEQDGIVVLQDTRAPVRMNPAGHYKLGDELLHAGTVPQFSGEHRCALKFKAFVIESWMAWALRGEEDAVHVWGYNNGELSRVARSDAAVAGHNEERKRPAGRGKVPIVVFGFNNQELGRVARSKEYDGPHRVGHYPLLEWDWGRRECLDYLRDAYGVQWIKSACGFCPFNEEAYKATDVGIARFAADPDAAVDGLFIEYVSMCFNPQGRLYQKRTMASVVRESPTLADVWTKFQRKLMTCEWAVYKVRRLFTVNRDSAGNKARIVRGEEPRETVARAVQVKAVGARATCDTFIDLMAYEPGHYRENRDGIARVYTAYRRTACPTAECFYVAAPKTVGNKVNGPMARFDERFDAADKRTTPLRPLPVLRPVAGDDYFGG